MSAPSRTLGHVGEVFLAFLLLGLTSFGGPVAHLGYFREAFVVRRKWLDDAHYGDLVALCQFLPGPASSQVGIAIGHMRAGWAGALAAFVGFTAPSVVMLWAVGLGAALWQGQLAASALHGLKVAALAVVALALWQMAERLTATWPRRVVALAAAAIVLRAAVPLASVAVIAGAALLGAATSRGKAMPVAAGKAEGTGPALALLALFAVLLVGLPWLAQVSGNAVLDIADRFYRTGALVFGGGHVVLPLLQGELVKPELIDNDLFLAGYGAAQAVPGPLFSFAFYAGMMLKAPPNGIAGGLLALGAIYLPSFLLVLGALPFWTRWRNLPRLRAGLDMANAAVVGLLLAALIDPVFPAAVRNGWDAALAAAALLALGLKLPPWAVVVACGAIAALLHL